MESIFELLAEKINLAHGLARGEALAGRQALRRDLVVDAEPLEGLGVVAAVLEDVADHVRPPSLLRAVPLGLGALIRPLRLAQLLRIVADAAARGVPASHRRGLGLRISDDLDFEGLGLASNECESFFVSSLIFVFLFFLYFCGVSMIFPPNTHYFLWLVAG